MKLPIALVLLSLSISAFGQSTVHYHISLEDPERHLVQVTMEIPAGGVSHELQLPVWNALYQVRDFAQYMNWIRAQDAEGKDLRLTQLNTSRWRVEGTENGATITYEMYADDPGPYGAQLNSQHAFFNLAEILLYADDLRNAPDQIDFEKLPPQWKIASSLRQNGPLYEANGYDQLVDSPVELGTFKETDFERECGKYRVVMDSENAAAKLLTIVPLIEKLVAAETKWMDDCPFQSYLFIYHASEAAGGGMEHAYSTAITLPNDDYEGDLNRFEGITAHEFFHLWNVKRIRPQSLAPIDYTKENYTRALWFSEGVDSTVSEYMLLRAGLLDEHKYLDHLGQQITELEDRPAHETQSAEQSSLDAWLEKYPHYGLPERSISYYNKGELLGVLLDLAMRDASHDQVSLRDLFHSLNDQYAKKGKFFAESEAVRESAEALSHSDLRVFFQKYVSGTDEIPWDKFFAGVGLRVNKVEAVFPDTGFEAVQKFNQQPVILRVAPESAAERAGLKSGDVILEINGQPATRKYEAQIADLGAGATLLLLVRRGENEYHLEWKLGTKERMIYQLIDVRDMNPQQRARREAWLFDKPLTNTK